MLIHKIIEKWGQKPPMDTINGMESIRVLRRIIRTGEYNDEDQKVLMDVRRWYIDNMLKK